MKTTKKLLSLLLVVSMLAGMLVMGVSAEGSTQIVSQQLSLGDDLTMRFDVAVDSQYQDSAVISVTVANGTPATYNVAEMTAGDNGYYQVYAELAAAQMTDTIAVNVYSGETVLAEGTYSIRDYCVYLLEGNYTDATKQMVKEVLNYGAAAQTYFLYNTDNLANDQYEIETTAQIPTDIEDMSISGKVSGISCYGMSLVFRNKVAIRYYFTAPNGVEGYTFTANEVQQKVNSKEDNLYYVEVADINPQEMDQIVELAVSDGTDTMTVCYSPLHYMARMSQKDTTSAELKDLLTAMYSYHLEAQEFVGIEKKAQSASIVDYKIVGSWVLDREASPSLAAPKSYDGNLETAWQPQASGNYVGTPGIIYMLDGYYDLTELSLTFMNREYFFDLYTSANGVDYTLLASVNAENYTDYFTNLAATVKTSDAKNVGYIKVIFTASNSTNNNTFVNLKEVQLTGVKLDKTAPAVIPANATIVDYQLAGTWVLDREATPSLAAPKSYDGDLTTSWQPQASGNYAGTPSIIYMLDGQYDLLDLKLHFDKREYFFELYTSADGLDYTLLADVTADNYTDYYADLTACFAGLKVENVGYVKIVFTGSNSTENNTFITLKEVQIAGVKLDKDAPGAIPDVAQIVDHQIVGNWVLDREDAPSFAAPKSYDGDASTGWQPQASSGYSGNSGIIYMLNGYYDISTLKLSFDKREYFFELYTSTDGKTFTQLVAVTAENYADYYTGLTALFTGLTATDVGYVKIVFTGSNSTDNNTFITLKEVQLGGAKLDKDAPTAIPKTIGIADYLIEGTWVLDRENAPSLAAPKSYDGDLTTSWQPQAGGNYAGTPSIIYMLNGYYDLTDLELHFDKREYFFELYTSTDGLSYTQIAAVTADNYTDYYTDLTATFTGLTAKDVGYVKIVFTGSNSENNNTFITLKEVKLAGAELDKDAPVAIPSKAKIVDYEIIGTWVNDRESTPSIGAGKSYDGDLATAWQPQASGNYAGTPGIIYMLNGYYDLSDFSVTFLNREYFFDLYTSVDGINYTLLASVNATNYTEYFTDLTANLTGLNVKSVGYIKVIFTASNSTNNNTFVNVKEVELTGVKLDKAAPTVIPTDAKITNYQITGSWVLDRETTPSLAAPKSYDGDLTTSWQPQASGAYAGNPSIVYMLDGYYDLMDLKLAFDKREYFFELYTSTDGVIYTQVAAVNATNYTDYYTDLTATFAGLEVKEVGYLKIVFTASNSTNNNTFITLKEVQPVGVKLDKDAPTSIPNFASVAGHKVIGAWVRDREDTPSLAPNKSYDGKMTVAWQPQASLDYVGDPGIIYMLDGYYDLSDMVLTFMNREYFFKLYTSTDGLAYSLIADVNIDTYTDYYSGLTASFRNITAKEVAYVKVIFTGSNSGNNNSYVNLYEIQFVGSRLDKDAPTAIPSTVSIASHSVLGTWTNADAGNVALSYDGENSTAWNPEATDYASGEGVVYELNGACTLNQLQLNFGSRKMYMNISVSTDGAEYTSVAQVTAENADTYYDGYVCTISNLSESNVCFIKVEFTGSSDETNYVDLFESVAAGEAA